MTRRIRKAARVLLNEPDQHLTLGALSDAVRFAGGNYEDPIYHKVVVKFLEILRDCENKPKWIGPEQKELL